MLHAYRLRTAIQHLRDATGRNFTIVEDFSTETLTIMCDGSEITRFYWGESCNNVSLDWVLRAQADLLEWVTDPANEVLCPAD